VKGRLNNMKKIAILVLAASAPRNLSLLAKALGDEFSLYVHVDQKMNIQSYKGAIDWPLLNFIEKRAEVFWAGFGMIEATINLMEAASASGDHSHYCLISDDTFILTEPDRLYNYIQQSPGDWIQTWRVPDDHLFQRRYSQFFYLDSKFSSPRWFLTEDRAVQSKDLTSIIELENLRSRGKVKLDNLFCGKQWWILTNEAVADLIKFHHANQDFRLSFKYSAVSDEIYIQTMYRILYPSKQTAKCPIYDDFTRDPKPYQFTSLEEVVRIPDFDEIRSKFPFIRKLKAPEETALSDVERVFWAKK
jgi:hypothetical protein